MELLSILTFQNGKRLQAEYFQYRHSRRKIPIQNIFSNNPNAAYFFRFFSISHCSMPFVFVHVFNNKSTVSLLYLCCAINRREAKIERPSPSHLLQRVAYSPWQRLRLHPS
jgi:hypothetical protein